jgi:hypothetical protein
VPSLWSIQYIWSTWHSWVLSVTVRDNAKRGHWEFFIFLQYKITRHFIRGQHRNQFLVFKVYKTYKMSLFGQPIRSRANGDNISVCQTEIMSPFGRLQWLKRRQSIAQTETIGVYTFVYLKKVESCSICLFWKQKTKKRINIKQTL